MKNKKRYSAKSTGELAGFMNVDGQPYTAYDMATKYGTYEIQPTAASDNEYPQIAQGMPKNHGNRKTDGKN